MGYNDKILKQLFMDYLNNNYQSFIEIRRKFHEIPELSRKEFKTSSFIQKILNDNGIKFKTNIGEKTGIVAIINGANKKKTVALRADMDALPMEEETSLPYSSKHSGVIHACGHDFHMASVLSAGIILNRFKDMLPINVKLIFQPAEEDGPVGGAKLMIRDGVLENPKVDSIFGMHVFTDVPLGYISVLNGPVMAAVDNFKVEIIGKGGHCASPELGIDPITISAHVLLNFHTLISRKVSATDSAVLSVGKIQGGNRRNIIPERVFLEGTMRTLNKDTREKMKAIIKKSCEMICESHGAKCVFQWYKSFDTTVNDQDSVDIVKKGVENFIGNGIIYENTKPFMASEDFGYYLKKTKGAFFWVGYKTDTSQPLHSAKLVVNEKVLMLGIKTFLGIVLEYCNRSIDV